MKSFRAGKSYLGKRKTIDGRKAIIQGALYDTYRKYHLSLLSGQYFHQDKRLQFVARDIFIQTNHILDLLVYILLIWISGHSWEYFFWPVKGCVLHEPNLETSYNRFFPTFCPFPLGVGGLSRIVIQLLAPTRRDKINHLMHNQNNPTNSASCLFGAVDDSHVVLQVCIASTVLLDH